MAEREGFEPSLGFHLNTISNRAPSATRTPLHENLIFAIRQLGIPVVQQVGNCKVPAALYLFALVDTNRAEALLGKVQLYSAGVLCARVLRCEARRIFVSVRSNAAANAFLS